MHHRSVDTELHNVLSRTVCTITRGHSFKLQKYLAALTLRSTFFQQIHDFWNELPGSVVDSESIAEFKKRLRNVDLSAHLHYPSSFLFDFD
jgi:hypothetical protein